LKRPVWEWSLSSAACDSRFKRAAVTALCLDEEIELCKAAFRDTIKV
jgi:hypothetical protein